MYFQKRNVVNILFILSTFFYINQANSVDFKLENLYLVEKKSIVLVERKLPKSRLLTEKNLKKIDLNSHRKYKIISRIGYKKYKIISRISHKKYKIK